MFGREILYLSIATILIVITLTAILVYLIVRKAIENWHKTKIASYQEQYNEHLLSYLMGSEFPQIVMPNSLDRKRAIEELLSRYSEIVEGEREKENLYYLAETYLSDYYRQGLSSRKWSTRMNALYHIEDFHIRSLENVIRNMINQKKITKAESVLGLRILSILQNEDLFEELTINHNSLSEFEYRSILIKADQKLLDYFINGFSQCGSSLQYAILEILALKNELNYVSFIESIYQTQTDELKLRALKALSSIGYVQNIQDYLHLCHSIHWQERMMLAKLLGTIRDAEGINCLENLIQDSSWWVRSQAAQSIKKYSNGQRVLKKIYETSTDPFAKDMALEWMNKGD